MPRVTDTYCTKCMRPHGEKHRATTKRPSLRTIERYDRDGVASATDGCRVEPDGVCPHGHSSWMLALGYI